MIASRDMIAVDDGQKAVMGISCYPGVMEDLGNQVGRDWLIGAYSLSRSIEARGVPGPET